MKKPTKNFTQVPNELWQLYARRLQNFKAEHIGLYTILRDYHNSEADDKGGYAFPTLYTLALDTGSSEDRVLRLLKVLEECGLVTKFRRKNNYDNNCYIVNDPITTEEEFYEKFPEAKAYYEGLLAKMDGRKANDKARKSKMYTEEQPVKGLEEVTHMVVGSEVVAKDTPQETTHQQNEIDTDWF